MESRETPGGKCTRANAEPGRFGDYTYNNTLAWHCGVALDGVGSVSFAFSRQDLGRFSRAGCTG